jgi:hypothetical protein
LEELDGSQGANRVLVIEGDHLSGKSYSVRLATQCQPRDRSIVINIADYESTTCDILELAQRFTEYREEKLPSYDSTKENEAVGRVLGWLVEKLKTRQLWLIVDHCNRPVVTEAARDLLIKLAQKIEEGLLPNVRLILVDLDWSKLPLRLKDNARRDTAEPPSKEQVSEWFKSLAEAAEKNYQPSRLSQLADGVYMNLDQSSVDANERYLEIEKRLCNAAQEILGL